jgi:hypothetical protein
MPKKQVYRAETYKRWRMSSEDAASGMLIVQHEFPNEFDDKKDICIQRDHDRLRSENSERVHACIKKHTTTGDMGIARRDTGSPIWGLELFAKHPESATIVFNTDNVPNLIPHSRYEKRR